MFSHFTGRMPFVRRVTPLLVGCALAAAANGQELNAPWLTSGSTQKPVSAQTQETMDEWPNPPPGGPAFQQPFAVEQVVHRIQAATERMEMVANSSRVVTLDQNIPRAQVNNREILELTPLSPKEIQVFAKKPGVTQINLWNDKGQLYTIDCVVFGDARELAELIRAEFPTANIRVRPLNGSVWLAGYIDRPDQLNQIVSLAQDYYPTVKNSIEVVSVQQVLLKVKVAEVSRTKLRQLGVDFAGIANTTDFVFTTGGGVLSASQFFEDGLAAPMTDTVRFGVTDNGTTFYGFIDALRRNNLVKIMAEPNLVTISGRAARFEAGGEIPYPSETSINGVSVDWKETGVIVDFLPIVLGNGNIRLETRPVVREVDTSRTVEVSPGVFAPAFTVRSVDTGVEMKPGQTLALAGLVSEREEALNSGIPWLADLPYLGVPFRRTRSESHEIELLIIVTPELVAPLDPYEVPQCLPGMHTDIPNDCELYWKGYIEVPSKGPCGPDGCPPGVDPAAVYQDGAILQEGAPGQGYEVISPGTPSLPPPRNSDGNAASRRFGTARVATTRPTASPQGALQSSSNSASRYHPSRPQNSPARRGTKGSGTAPGFIGPVGYDVKN